MIELDKLAGPKGGEQGSRLADFWKGQIQKAQDDSKRKDFIRRGRTIERTYRNERGRTSGDGDNRRYASLWSNVEILKPAIYGKSPVPYVERRFKDKDPSGRYAAQILERALRNEIEINGFHEAMCQARDDYLLPGLGTVWVRYEPEVEEGVSVATEGNMDLEDAQGPIEPEDEDAETPTDEELEPPETNDEENEPEPEEAEEGEKLRETGDQIVRESCPVDYIHWEDFFMFPVNARTWREVTAVAKRVYMTKEQMTRRFGKEIGKAVPLKKDDRGAGKYDGVDTDPMDKGEVFEIWSMTNKEVVWIAEGYSYLCDRKDDPLQLENFWPCPHPLFANKTTGTLIPVADYIEYQDQAIQIDELTMRINLLAKACKVAGVYNASAKDIARIFNESIENELIPVDDWTAFAQDGGVAGNISMLPLKEIIGVLNELMQVKDKCIQEMDRLTGITDIMRGTTDARETMGGQRLKANSSGTRLQSRQNEVARFARDTVRIMADIMAQHFSDQSLVDVSGALYEEGLGDVDIISLQDISQQMQPHQLNQMGQPPNPFGLPPPQGSPQAGPPQMPGQPPQPQMPPHAGLPGQLGPGMPMLPPEIMAKIKAKLEGVQRITKGLQIIRDQRLRGFRIDIEVDSTIYGDNQEEKQDRIQFITAITGYLQQALALSAQAPEIAPLLGKFLQFGVRGFKVGRDLESAIEDFCDEAVQIAQKHQQMAAQAAQSAPQQKTATAQLIKAQASAQTAKDKSQTDKMKMVLGAKEKQQKIVADQQKDQTELQHQQMEDQADQANNSADLRMKAMEMQMKEMELQFERMRMLHETMMMSREAMKPMVEAGTPQENQ
ncbi:MAG TPA: hypothetical protein VFR24_27460 [Candidatus Angelobacter sp.]|nr:hypothetical protein [Candidatus Angelobacter sp.]